MRHERAQNKAIVLLCYSYLSFYDAFRLRNKQQMFDMHTETTDFCTLIFGAQPNDFSVKSEDLNHVSESYLILSCLR